MTPRLFAMTDSPGQIADLVMAGDIVILKRFLDPAALDVARAALVHWRNKRLPQNLDRISANTSYWRRDNNPPQSKTKHIFDSYFITRGDDEFWRATASLFQAMQDLWQALTGRRERIGELRPQVLYYPCGGGHFEWHDHSLAPQQIGLILGLSKIGRDFHQGGTQFRTVSGVVDTDTEHDLGDVCLFRYDLMHRVTPIDPERPLTWDGNGRWTAVLPLL